MNGTKPPKLVPTIEFELHTLWLDEPERAELLSAGYARLWVELHLLVIPQPWRSGRVAIPVRGGEGDVHTLELKLAAGQLELPDGSDASELLRRALASDDLNASSIFISLHRAR